jgi:putative membrane protein
VSCPGSDRSLPRQRSVVDEAVHLTGGPRPAARGVALAMFRLAPPRRPSARWTPSDNQRRRAGRSRSAGGALSGVARLARGARWGLAHRPQRCPGPWPAGRRRWPVPDPGAGDAHWSSPFPLGWCLRLLLAVLVAALLVAPRSVLAAGIAHPSEHDGQPLAPHDLWTAWTLAPPVLLGLAITAAVYGRGVRVVWRRAGKGRVVAGWRVGAFGAALGTLFIALVSPLDALGGALFAAHMVQHVLLIAVAAPLLVLGVPRRVLPWGLPPGPGRRLGARLGRGWAHLSHLAGRWRLSHLLVAWALHAIAIWIWHVPALYGAALAGVAIHALEHLTFLGTALLLWSASFGRMGGGRGASPGPGGVLAVFATAMHSGALGALMTFATTPWYPEHATGAAAWGLTGLEDQQLAGLIMWLPGGFLYLLAAAGIFAVWLHQSAVVVAVAPRPSPAMDGSAPAAGTADK